MPGGSVEPLGVGVVGLGRSGMFHIERLGLREDCRVLGACDTDPKARAKGAGLPFPVDATGERLLDQPQVELLLIATPPAIRASLALAALRAGKHVVVEAPMCLTLRDADALVDASRRAGKMLSIAHLGRWDDDFLTARAAIREFGRLQVARSIVWQYNPGFLRSGGAGAAWKADRSLGGGLLWQLGVHAFDQLLQFVPEEPSAVFARFTKDPAAPDCDQAFVALVEFPGGCLAHVEFNRSALAPFCTGWMIAAERGAYANFTEYTATAETEVVDVPLMPVRAPADQYFNEVIAHLREGGPNPVTAEEGRGVVALLTAVQEAGAAS